jgi:DegV family protein with EDD domain
MPEIAIISDSTAYLPNDLVERYQIDVAPQILIWGEETLEDGIDIQPLEFYERLKTTDVLPKTSQATIGCFKEMFEPYAKAGTPILAILISDQLSGTISSAEQAKAMYPNARIEIVNSKSAAMDLGFQVLAAARAADEGKSFEEVVAVAQNAKLHTGVLFVVDTLEFLHRNGRIGGAARLLGTAINLKPILEVQDGRIEPVERVRTKKKAYARVLDLLEDRLGGRPAVRISTLHAAALEDAELLMEAVKERFAPIETVFSEVSPVVGAHVGPGTVGLCYSTEI